MLLLVFNNLDDTYESLTVGVYDVFRLVENAESIILVVGNVSFIIFLFLTIFLFYFLKIEIFSCSFGSNYCFSWIRLKKWWFDEIS